MVILIFSRARVIFWQLNRGVRLDMKYEMVEPRAIYTFGIPICSYPLCRTYCTPLLCTLINSITDQPRRFTMGTDQYLLILSDHGLSAEDTLTSLNAYKSGIPKRPVRVLFKFSCPHPLTVSNQDVCPHETRLLVRPLNSLVHTHISVST